MILLRNYYSDSICLTVGVSCCFLSGRMSLPQFSGQSSLFSTAAIDAELFGAADRYRLFAQKIYPLLVRAREVLTRAYCQDNGRPAVEPVWLLGVSLLQFLEGAPDRQALEMLRYHAGWNFALNRQLGQDLFDPTTLVHFRQRLITHGLSRLTFESILQGLLEAGLVERRTAQRLDSMQVFGLVSRMSRLECVRETLRLALRYLEDNGPSPDRPAFWAEQWDRYVATELDYRTEAATLRAKMDQAGRDGWALLDWIKGLDQPALWASAAVELLKRVLTENFVRACDHI